MAVSDTNGPTTSENEQAFRLLDLPPEIWSRICRYAVVPGLITIPHPGDQEAVASNVAQPPISRTCRILRAETLKLFYSKNEFRFIDHRNAFLIGLIEWVRALGPTAWWPLIRTTIQSDCSDVVLYLEKKFVVELQDSAPKNKELKILRFRVMGMQEDEQRYTWG